MLKLQFDWYISMGLLATWVGLSFNSDQWQIIIIIIIIIVIVIIIIIIIIFRHVATFSNIKQFAGAYVESRDI